MALCWPCWAPSTSKTAGVLNQGDSAPPSHTYTHFVLPGALKGVFSLLILNRSLLSKLEIKGCDFRLEDQSERGVEEHYQQGIKTLPFDNITNFNIKKHSFINKKY